MGNSLSCLPLKRKKGRESDFIRHNWRQLLKHSSKATNGQGANVGLYIRRVGKFDEEWELVDLEDDAYCLSAVKENVPSPRRLDVSPCITKSSGSSRCSVSVDLVDIEDDDLFLSVAREQLPSSRRIVLSPRHTISPRSPRSPSNIDKSIVRVDEDIGEENDDKNSDSDKIMDSGGHTGEDNEDDEAKDDTEIVRDTTNSDRPPSDSSDYCIDELCQHLDEECRGDNKVYSPNSDLSTESPATTHDGGERETTRMYADIADLFEVILDRVEAAYAYREVSDDEDEGRLTPPQIEGDIYRGAGILKTTQFGDTSAETRRITWGDDVKPPAKNGPDLDPITAAFARERSNLLLQRTSDQKARLRVARRARLRHAKFCALMMIQEIPKSRLPVKVKDWQPEIDTERSYKYKPVHVPKGSHIPVRVIPQVNNEDATNNAMSFRTPDGGNGWPQRLEDMDSASARSYYVEQFQGQLLFKQRLRKKKMGDNSWSLGLTPFQRWVIENVGTAVTKTVGKR